MLIDCCFHAEGKAVQATLVNLGRARLNASVADMATELDALMSMLKRMVSQLACSVKM
jgi:hypothetical protein